MAKRINKAAWVFVIAAIVFAIIALPTFLCGCHKDIQPNCLRYYLYNTTVVEYLIEKLVCTECSSYERSCGTECTGSGDSRSCTESCTTYCVYTNYDCYYSYAITSYDGNSTCQVNVVSASREYQYAVDKAIEVYPLGYTFDIYIDKSNYQCYTESNVQALAITGLVFFCLVGVCMILFGICAIWC